MIDQTQNALRLQVAKLCGRKPGSVTSGGYCMKCGGKVERDIPDYPNDLNACREFELTLSRNLALPCYVDYVRALAAIKGTQIDNILLIIASADERCQALVKAESSELFGEVDTEGASLQSKSKTMNLSVSNRAMRIVRHSPSLSDQTFCVDWPEDLEFPQVGQALRTDAGEATVFQISHGKINGAPFREVSLTIYRATQ